MLPKKKSNTNHKDEKETNTGSKAYWQKWYILVIAFLVVQVILFYMITEYFK